MVNATPPPPPPSCLRSATTAAPTLEGQSQEGAPKVPEVLSSLERLSQATGGMEKSWYRCIFPFGIISLVIGVAGTGVTYTYNDLPQTKVVSVILLIVGLVLVLMATTCWTVHKKKRRKKNEGGSFSSDHVLKEFCIGLCVCVCE
uniref:Transmembrane protein 100 n=1 Tax=Sinocyclocheilus anshuiensis TaxID=1608454 RepID=A0A671T7M5_9TELE